MSCDCYKIGGPWITYDPNCPAHGDEARRERKEQEEREAKLEDEALKLRQEHEQTLKLLAAQNKSLEAMNENIGKMLDLITNLDFRLNALEKKVARGFVGTTRFK